MLTPLQEEVARIIAALAEASEFGLAGGAALILYGEVDRQTQDLDFFGLRRSDVDALVPAAERALSAAGMKVARIRDGAGFVRLAVQKGGDATEVDIATDARLFPLEMEENLPS